VRPSILRSQYLAPAQLDYDPGQSRHGGKQLPKTLRAPHGRISAAPSTWIDIFRNSSQVMPVVDEALTLSRREVIWMQLGARDDAAAEKAEAAGLKVVMNRCPKIEYGRLSSEISWMGVNSRTLSSSARRSRPRACACR